ncbi:random slug protein 5-like [Ananas comosus]|uniref:Random slug protein 5-like n=2 Tax=Ananas comosus TaxID=4615 RepID=A0A6P5F350_ANACO|nr:random slug protein 5-like [Ananas comosus]
MSVESTATNGSEKLSLVEERKAKINEVRAILGPLSGKSALYCLDASIARYLTARNWNVKKATKMLKETLKWRSEYKPEEICWDEVAAEAETGKIYRTSYCDKHGRSILVMRPGCQNTKSVKGQVKYLVYCMENAILNLPPSQEQMVWLIDFQGFNLSHLSVKVTKETAHVLQEHYPERLGVAILYNPPKIFESFWLVVRPFLEPKTYRKVKFVYSDNPNTKKIMEDLFNMDELESAFGGNNQVAFNINDYGARMKEEDKRMPLMWTPGSASISSEPFALTDQNPNSSNSESDSELEKEHKKGDANAVDSACSSLEGSLHLNGNGSSAADHQQ